MFRRHVTQDDCEADCQCFRQTFGPGAISQGMDEMNFLRSASSAAQRGDVEKLRRMLDRDPDAADMDTSDPSTCPDGYAPLHYAARSGALACVKLLVERGADINRLTRAGRASALMRASYMGDLDMVLYLLENGADPTLQDSDGETALFKAAARGHGDVAKALRRASPETLTLKTNKGEIPADKMPSLATA